MSILESCPACGSSDVAAMSQQNRALSQTVETLLAEAERLRDGRAETARLRAEVERLQAVVDAALRLRESVWDGALWVVSDLSNVCVGCLRETHSDPAELVHADDCPAIALDRALDALSR